MIQGYIAYTVQLRLRTKSSKPAHKEIMIIVIAVIGLGILFLLLQPQFRFLNNKQAGAKPTQANQKNSSNAWVRISSNDDVAQKPNDVQNESQVGVTTQTQASAPTTTSSSSSSPFIKVTCDEKLKADYTANYNASVVAENKLHEEKLLGIKKARHQCFNR